MNWNYKIFVFTLLTLATLFCHGFIQRYEQNGREILSDNWSFYTPKTGKVKITKNELYLFSSDKSHSVSIQQDISSFVHDSILELSADMQCKNISPGKRPWNHARFLLVQQDTHNPRYNNVSYIVASITGTKQWRKYKKFFSIKHDIKKLRVSAQLNHCTGSFQLRDIHLSPVRQTKAYTLIKRIILSSWAVFAIFLIGSCFNCGKKIIILQVMVAIAFVAIIAGTTIPGYMKIQVLNGVKREIHTITSGTFENIIPWNLSKMGHFCFFALFALVLSMLLHVRSALPVIFNIFLIAGGTEMAQFLIDGRSPLFMDFIIDLGGGFAGILLIKIIDMTKLKINKLKLK